MAIRLFVIEDHAPIIVAGLKRLFYATRDGIEVAGESTSVEEAIRIADPDRFDVIILDLWLENRRPVENIRNLRSHFSSKPIVIYTSETSLVWKRRMYEEGAAAYVLKTAHRGEIKPAIECAAAGKTYNPLALTNFEVAKNQTPHDKQEPILSITEKEILFLLKNGSSHKEIARIIEKSQSFVDKILKDLRDRFEVKNNIELLSKMKLFEDLF